MAKMNMDLNQFVNRLSNFGMGKNTFPEINLANLMGNRGQPQMQAPAMPPMQAAPAMQRPPMPQMPQMAQGRPPGFPQMPFMGMLSGNPGMQGLMQNPAFQQWMQQRPTSFGNGQMRQWMQQRPQLPGMPQMGQRPRFPMGFGG